MSDTSVPVRGDGVEAAAQDAVVLRATGLGKCYPRYDSPRERVLALLGRSAPGSQQWSLQDVSFALRRGQCLGLVGDNGAGKSTLLKIVAGALHPSAGRLERRGRVTAILELGAGFHPEFSGRENLYFGGALAGFDEGVIRALEPAIIEFAELEDAIDRPVKTYSSGMVVRLAFALVTAVEPDLLIIDEALAVGDQHFQKKCVERIEAFRRNGCTVLFCSHSMYHIRQLCDQALWLDGGRVRALGPTEAVLAAYEAHVRALDSDSAVHNPAPARGGRGDGRRAALVSVEVAGLGEGSPPRLMGSDLVVQVVAEVQGDECPSIGVMLEQANGVGITSVASHADGARARSIGPGKWAATVTFPDLPLHSGEYVVSAYLFDSAGIVVYDEWRNCQVFSWVYPSLTPGLVRLPHRWS